MAGDSKVSGCTFVGAGDTNLKPWTWGREELGRQGNPRVQPKLVSMSTMFVEGSKACLRQSSDLGSSDAGLFPSVKTLCTEPGFAHQRRVSAGWLLFPFQPNLARANVLIAS